jgi:integrase
MDTTKGITASALQQRNEDDQPAHSAAVKVEFDRDENPDCRADADADAAPIVEMSVLEFVERKYIPEFVLIKRSAGRSYFRSMLKHVLSPEQIARVFGATFEDKENRLKTIPGWPYLDSLRLSAVNAEVIQNLTTAAASHGYSIQTVTHIRNVVRSLLSHAIKTGVYSGNNPATLVTMPAMIRKEAYTLTLAQLQDLLATMRYPERPLAVLAILTGMSVAEICGLQWKYVNLSSIYRPIDNDVIPPRTIAVWNQWYRGEFAAVPIGRRRFVRIPDLLASIVKDLKGSEPFTSPREFVLVSRNGTPIHPENIAARRLKPIGESLEMPWISWHVFHRTHVHLKSQFGRRFHEELETLPALSDSRLMQPQNGFPGTPVPVATRQYPRYASQPAPKSGPFFEPEPDAI